MALKEIENKFAETLRKNLEINKIGKIDELIEIHYPASHRKILKKDFKKYIRLINDSFTEKYEFIIDKGVFGEYGTTEIVYIKRTR